MDLNGSRVVRTGLVDLTLSAMHNRHVAKDDALRPSVAHFLMNLQCLLVKVHCITEVAKFPIHLANIAHCRGFTAAVQEFTCNRGRFLELHKSIGELALGLVDMAQ